MPEVRTEYPFQVSYRDDRLPGSLFCLRAETAEDLGREYVELLAVLDPILGVPAVDQQAVPTDAPKPSSPQAAAPPASKPNLPITKLPKEALEALAAQKKGLCVCQDKWWDNRETKTNPRAPDFRCVKCQYPIWLTAPKGEE
jgi:hypothetical protein